VAAAVTVLPVALEALRISALKVARGLAAVGEAVALVQVLVLLGCAAQISFNMAVLGTRLAVLEVHLQGWQVPLRRDRLLPTG